MSPKTKRRLKLIAGAIILLWLIGNLGYRAVVAWRISAYESSIQWNAEGVHPAATEYATGESETAVLLVHGVNDTPEVWNRFAPELAKRQYYVRAMRLPGFGQSTTEYGAYSWQDWVEDVAGELRQLRHTHRKVILVGHSLGGGISIATCRLHPELMDACVLMAPAVGVSNARSPVLPTKTWHQLSYLLVPLITATESPFEPDALDVECRAMASRTRFVPRRVVDELFALLDENGKHPEQFQSPVLLITAAEDHVVENKAAERYFKRIASRQKLFREMEGTAHLIQRDLKWQSVVNVTADWIGATALSDEQITDVSSKKDTDEG